MFFGRKGSEKGAKNEKFRIKFLILQRMEQNEEKQPYDVIVIGAGAAGLMAAGTAAQNGHRVLLLEKLSLIHISEPTRP